MGYKVEIYKTDSDNELYPTELRERVEGAGLLYKSAIAPMFNSAREYMFYGKGIAGSIGYDNTMPTHDGSLRMQVFSNSPRTSEQQKAVVQLLLRLPMFNKEE
tara:strand:+ start:4493 stop:4801 length:309 start_codon:yes stop_codon:yes gene_type:complete